MGAVASRTAGRALTTVRLIVAVVGVPLDDADGRQRIRDEVGEPGNLDAKKDDQDAQCREQGTPGRSDLVRVRAHRRQKRRRSGGREQGAVWLSLIPRASGL